MVFFRSSLNLSNGYCLQDFSHNSIEFAGALIKSLRARLTLAHSIASSPAKKGGAHEIRAKPLSWREIV
jgi:hypothetical protein